MARGRRSQPDALKALKGNPGKRKLVFDNAGKGGAVPHSLAVAVPDFLTHERERTIFTRIVDDYLQRRIARPADITAYGRWASYVHRWVSCKELLEGKQTFYQVVSNHGTRWARLPMFKDMLDLERVLQSLEDRLGLNPVARQNIIRGLSSMPAALGGLFGDEPAQTDTPIAGEDGAPAHEEEPTPSPIGLGRLN